MEKKLARERGVSLGIDGFTHANAHSLVLAPRRLTETAVANNQLVCAWGWFSGMILDIMCACVVLISCI